MSDYRDRINLCIASKAVGGRYELADAYKIPCPLRLNKSQAKHCLCKSRTDVGRIGGGGYIRWDGTMSPPTSEQTIHVLQCHFPLKWDGEPLQDPERYGAYLRQRSQR